MVISESLIAVVEQVAVVVPMIAETIEVLLLVPTLQR
jgi:hypothetical protein